MNTYDIFNILFVLFVVIGHIRESNDNLKELSEKILNSKILLDNNVVYIASRHINNLTNREKQRKIKVAIPFVTLNKILSLKFDYIIFHNAQFFFRFTRTLVLSLFPLFAISWLINSAFDNDAIGSLSGYLDIFVDVLKSTLFILGTIILSVKFFVRGRIKKFNRVGKNYLV